jgi:cytochrome c-type biogenesis protein CcmH
MYAIPGLILGVCFLMHGLVKADVLFFDYVWETKEQQQLFSEISSELRCVVCQSQTLSDSYAPLALEMKDQIYRQIKEHKTKKEIIDYFVLRYGESVHYHPSFSWKTASLWILPWILLMVMIGRLRRHL